MKKITVMTPCYNEEGNIEDLSRSTVKLALARLKTFPHTAPRRWQPSPTANQL